MSNMGNQTESSNGGVSPVNSPEESEVGKVDLNDLLLMNNLQIVEKRLRDVGLYGSAYTVRLALDKLYPEWREQNDH
jgi:hypothetical protein